MVELPEQTLRGPIEEINSADQTPVLAEVTSEGQPQHPISAVQAGSPKHGALPTAAELGASVNTVAVLILFSRDVGIVVQVYTLNALQIDPRVRQHRHVEFQTHHPVDGILRHEPVWRRKHVHIVLSP